MKKILLIALAAMLAASVLLAGCSASSSEDMTQADEGYYAEAEAPNAAPAIDGDYEKDTGEYVAEDRDESGGAGSSIDYDSSILEPDVNRKIVYYGTVEAQTTNFDEDYDAIKTQLVALDGYVQYSSVSGTRPEDWQDTGRFAQITLRVPNDRFDDFMKFLGEMGETLSSSVSGEDISLQYYNTEQRLETLRTQEKKLHEFLDAAESSEDMITIYRELSNVSSEIEQLESSKRNYDSLINFSTVTIYLTEVNVVDKVTPGEKTLGERISSGFYAVLNFLADFGEGLLVFLIAGAPILIPLAAIVVLIIWLVKRSKRRRAKKAAAGYNPYDPRSPQGGGPTPGNPHNPQGGDPDAK